MAGVRAANANNPLGISGINGSSQLLPVRVVGKCGGYESDIADGMRWAVGIAVPGVQANANTADVLNVSLSSSGRCSTALQSAINEVISAGAPIVVAAGNSSVDASGYSPGNCSGVITVAAVDHHGGKPTYTNFGASVALAAPGGIANGTNDILTTFNQGLTSPNANNAHFLTQFGTSIAAAHVTGVASLVLSEQPALRPDQVKDVLQDSARAFPTNTPSLGSQADCTTALCGAGIADARVALLLARLY